MRREGNCGRRVAASSGLGCAEAEDVIYTRPTSGSCGRKRNHYLPPESRPSHVVVSVGFHIKMDPLLLQHPTSPLLPPPTGASSSSSLSHTEGVLLIRKNNNKKKRREGGNEQEKMTRKKKRGLGKPDGRHFFMSKH